VKNTRAWCQARSTGARAAPRQSPCTTAAPSLPAAAPAPARLRSAAACSADASPPGCAFPPSLASSRVLTHLSPSFAPAPLLNVETICPHRPGREYLGQDLGPLLPAVGRLRHPAREHPCATLGGRALAVCHPRPHPGADPAPRSLPRVCPTPPAGQASSLRAPPESWLPLRLHPSAWKGARAPY
jgi:hypothetical protein